MNTIDTEEFVTIKQFARNWDKRAKSWTKIATKFTVNMNVDESSTSLVKALATLTPVERSFIIEMLFKKMDAEISEKLEQVFYTFLEKRRKVKVNQKQKLRKREFDRKSRQGKPAKALKRTSKPKPQPASGTKQ